MGDDRPNILFILADDMGAWAMRCAGNSDIHTPNLDRLAANGVRFDNFFCVSPVCSPARASLLTGRLPSAHGVHDWIRSGSVDKARLGDMGRDPYYVDEYKPVRYLEGQPCYTDILSRSGYDCALCGKWHLGDSLTPQHGFNRWYTIGRGGCRYYRPDIVEDGAISFSDRYVTDLITEKALGYIDELSHGDCPFYLSVHYTAPHSPWDEDQHPSDIYDLYRDCDFLATPDLPIHPDQVSSAPYGTGEERKRLLGGYYTAITAMDRDIGLLLDELDRLELTEKTLIFFTSDNGMSMGHHGIWGKGNGTFPLNLFDTAVKVPAILSWRGHVGPSLNTDLLSHYDVSHTLLQFAGCPEGCMGEGLPGRSFVPLLTDGDTARKWTREDAFDERTVCVYDEYGPSRMIRTRTAKLIHRYPYGPDELYDLVHDPDETVNLINDPEYRSLRERLYAHMQSWFLKYTDPTMDATKEGVTGFGQLGLCGIRSEGRAVYAPITENLYT